jgi:hypothetical protein
MEIKNKHGKRDKHLPFSHREVYAHIQNWTKVPYKALLDIINQDYIQKSPCSFSFYNRSKDWDYTEPDTLRFSDHWNFTIPRTGNRIHAKTNIPVPDNTWVKAKYDISTDIFIVEEIYDSIETTREQIKDLKNILNPDNCLFKLEEDIIEKRKAFGANVKSGKVLCNYGGVLRLVTKMNYQRFVLDDGEIVDRKVSTRCFHTFEEMIPDFYLMVNGEKVTEQELKQQNIF